MTLQRPRRRAQASLRQQPDLRGSRPLTGLLLLVLLLLPAALALAQEEQVDDDTSSVFLPVALHQGAAAAREFTVDGTGADWAGIEPGLSDIEGDNREGVPGSDLKAAYMSQSEGRVYYMVELWDPPPHEQPATVEMDFYAYYDDGSVINFHTNIGSGLNVWTRDDQGDIHEYPVSDFEVAWGEVVEMSLALSDIKMPVETSLRKTNFWVEIDGSNTPVDFMRAGITINGDGSDWAKIEPRLTDVQGDQSGDSRTDLEAGYDSQEENAVYFMVDVYDPPPFMPGVIELDFVATYDGGMTRRYGTNIRSDDSLGVWLEEEDGQPVNEQVDVQAYGVAWGEVIEMGIALDELEEPFVIETIFVAFWADSGSGLQNVDIMEP